MADLILQTHYLSPVDGEERLISSTQSSPCSGIKSLRHFTARIFRDPVNDYSLEIRNERQGSVFYFQTDNPEQFRLFCSDLHRAAEDGFELLPRLEEI